MKNTHLNTKQTKIKLALLMAVIIAVALTLAACEMSNFAVGEDDYSFVLSDTTPTEITYEQGEQASPLTITLTFDEGQSEGIYYVRWLEIYDDSVITGVMEQFVYKLRITEDDGEVVQLPSFPNNTPVEFTYTPSTSEVGTKHYVLEAEYKYSAAVNVGSVCNSAESSRTHTESLRSEVIAVTVTDPNAPPVNNGDDSDLTLEITAEPQSANYTQNASDVSALSVEISTNASDENVTYAWFKNTENSTTGGTAISGANSANYTPSTTADGTFYYYCTVTAKDADEEKTATSAVATIKVGNTQQLSQTEYNFAITSQPTGGTYTAGSTATLSVAATTNSGNALSYQWFTNLTNSTSGSVAVQGATGSTFNVTTINNSNQYYYCVVTDTHGGQTHTRTSNIVNVSVTGSNNVPAPPEVEELWVEGVLVTPANAHDILNTTTPSSGATASYDYATKTLTLENFTSSGYVRTSVSPNAYQNAVIGANFDLTINIERGTSIISGSSSTLNAKPTAGIYVDGDLTFVGGGNITITGTHQQHGVIVTGDMLVDVDTTKDPLGYLNGVVSANGAHGADATTTGATGGNGFSGVHVGGTLTVNKATLGVNGGTGGTGNNIYAGGSGGITGPGGKGGVGIIATEINVLSGGTLEAIGGNGGNGGDNKSGGNGGNGGVGNFAYVGVLTNNGTVTLTGGSGGNGGNGDGTESGGNGGAGYFAFGSGSVLTNNGTGTADVTGGNGGQGGQGGSSGGAGGDGGDGGDAHNGNLQGTAAATIKGGNGGNGGHGSPFGANGNAGAP